MSVDMVWTWFGQFCTAYIQIYDSKDCLTFVSVTLLFANPVRDHRPWNRSAIPTTGYGQASAQIQVYLDWTTQLSLPAQTVLARPAIYRKTSVQSVADLELSWVGSFIDGAKIAETVTTALDDELSKLPQQSVLEQMGLQSASEHRQRQLQWTEWRRKSISRRRSMDGEASLADSCSSARDNQCSRCCQTEVPTISRSDWPS